MSNEVMQVSIAFITFLTAAITGFFAWKGRNAAVSVKKDVAEVKTEIKEVKAEVKEVLVPKIEEYHKEVNGKVTQLLEAKDQETIAKEAAAMAIGEKKGAEDNQLKTDAKEQDKK